jgi:hypothetical protein
MAQFNNNHNTISMEPNAIPGKPGLAFILLGAFFNILDKIHRADITFILGTVATLLAIIYYLIQIFKPKK